MDTLLSWFCYEEERNESKFNTLKPAVILQIKKKKEKNVGSTKTNCELTIDN
jgi:hypothetical protein